MITTVNESQFRDAFRDMGRADGWSYNGLGALYAYLEQYAEDSGQEVELDVVALCCEFSEYPSALACIEDRGYDGFEFDPDLDADEQEEAAREFLQENGTLIEFENKNTITDLGSGVIVGEF